MTRICRFIPTPINFVKKKVFFDFEIILTKCISIKCDNNLCYFETGWWFKWHVVWTKKFKYFESGYSRL